MNRIKKWILNLDCTACLMGWIWREIMQCKTLKVEVGFWLCLIFFLIFCQPKICRRLFFGNAFFTYLGQYFFLNKYFNIANIKIYISNILCWMWTPRSVAGSQILGDLPNSGVFRKLHRISVPFSKLVKNAQKSFRMLPKNLKSSLK